MVLLLAGHARNPSPHGHIHRTSYPDAQTYGLTQPLISATCIMFFSVTTCILGEGWNIGWWGVHHLLQICHNLSILFPPHSWARPWDTWTKPREAALLWLHTWLQDVPVWAEGHWSMRAIGLHHARKGYRTWSLPPLDCQLSLKGRVPFFLSFTEKQQAAF